MSATPTMNKSGLTNVDLIVIVLEPHSFQSQCLHQSLFNDSSMICSLYSTTPLMSPMVLRGMTMGRLRTRPFATMQAIQEARLSFLVIEMGTAVYSKSTGASPSNGSRQHTYRNLSHLCWSCHRWDSHSRLFVIFGISVNFFFI
jgi:hypothetical protein